MEFVYGWLTGIGVGAIAGGMLVSIHNINYIERLEGRVDHLRAKLRVLYGDTE